MRVKWFPWKWLIKRAARSYQILDPFMVMARLRKFAEPSEIDAPLELIRAWTVFQARGVVNTRAIQHNLDWVWPYWVERQFDPDDVSFIPRSFSMAHINLTHRNWTAVCLPDTDAYSLVDPRGLVTPLHDGWSIEAWIVDGNSIMTPGREQNAHQIMNTQGELSVVTRLTKNDLLLETRAEMARKDDGASLQIAWNAAGHRSSQLCVALRPYNPEGIQFIDSIKTLKNEAGWKINGHTEVKLNRRPKKFITSNYANGDVFNMLDKDEPLEQVSCDVGMATAVAVFPFDPEGKATVKAEIPLNGIKTGTFARTRALRPKTSWEKLDRIAPELDIPDDNFKYLYSCSVRTLLSLSAGEIYPGSYTYRRFWFRDACLMLNALLCLNHDETAKRAFKSSFAARQTARGFFESQQGEWDSNGQALWIAGRYESLAGLRLSDADMAMFKKATKWLMQKRHVKAEGKPPGLLPAGFSAEHLGPNNFYYWDNFWGVAGLRMIAEVFERHGQNEYAREVREDAADYFSCIMKSINSIPMERSRGAIPAAQNRRMDGGSVGSLVGDYPLQLFDPGDPKIMNTVEFLLGNSMVKNAFFHDMTHSGVNPYLTLHLAQILLRAGDNRYIKLVKRISELASSTGQWPEAIHPATGGGCMGDGQHGWAAAEWALMIRSLFVREEPGKLVVASGLFPEWLKKGSVLKYGPTSTAFGKVTVNVQPGRRTLKVNVTGQWHGDRPVISAESCAGRKCEVEIS